MAVRAEARAAGLVVIGDVKRGDLGSTLEAYAQAWLTPGEPLEVDAMTISAFQGFGALRIPLDLAARNDKGLFVLAATSNPEALAVQTARIEREAQTGKTLAGALATRVVNWNRAHSEGRPIGAIGVVLGATVDFVEYGIDLGALAEGPAAPILAPGFGYQGAQFADVKRLFGVAAGTTIVTASRSILASGPAGLSESIARQSELLGEAIA